MKKVFLTKAFQFWHNGCQAKTYGPGEIEVEDEVFAAAEACGVVKDNLGTDERSITEAPSGIGADYTTTGVPGPYVIPDKNGKGKRG